METERMNIVIVGHVDHGKSTLIGRLLADTNSLPKGKIEQIKTYCTTHSKSFEYAFLLDALKDEQAQGITIDSARCFFKSKQREYLIIDAPGHVEFLKNMISGAARAEAAVLVVDANAGIQENTKRHGYVLSLLGIEQVLVVVNKMDLVGYNEHVFQSLQKKYTSFLNTLGVTPLAFIPASAYEGDNIVSSSSRFLWFKGKTLLESLDCFTKQRSPVSQPFRMPVQDVYSTGTSKRIIAGRIESGSIAVGDSVLVLPSFKESRIQSIETLSEQQTPLCTAGYSTGITLTDPMYVQRGNIICKSQETRPHVSSLIRATLFWMGDDSLRIDKKYKLKLGTFETSARIKAIHHVLNASDLSYYHKNSVQKNEVAHVTIECSQDMAFDLFHQIPSLGRFVIIDEFALAGGGTILDFSDTQNGVQWHEREITRDQRSKMLGHQSVVVWLTGLSASGKSTIAVALQKKLIAEGKLTYVLDGDNVRHGLNRDLGFSEEDRIENIRRIGEVTHLFADAGVITLAAFISPYKKDRKVLREKLKEDFIEIYVKCSIEECERRDPKGLYKKAKLGQIPQFTGITAPYEEPEHPELVIASDILTVEESVEKIYAYLKEKKIV